MSLNKREHDLWFPILVETEGEYCAFCTRTPKIDPSSHLYVPRLLIHEIEYKRPIQRDLICLCCDSCNQKIHPEKPERFTREPPPELLVNRQKEPLAREYIINRVLMDGSIERNKVLSAAAEKARCSIKACEDYLDKLTSDEGMLIEILDVVYLRGYEPMIKFDIMSTRWVEDVPAKPIPQEVVKAIQQTLRVV